MRKVSIFIITLFISFMSSFAQRGVSFYIDTQLDRMLKIAQNEDKLVFIDTYTSWCIPCKKLEKEFLNKELGAFLNANFVNVKFDMDTPAGKEIFRKYDVFFVPTLLILDGSGNILARMESGTMSAPHILDMARSTQEGEYINEEESILQAEKTRRVGALP